ncbi:MAG: hypothetical protein OXL41_08850 [Nitrospinae bacterium]|nr:hypothetical protein [Nitrospinota bacterium]
MSKAISCECKTIKLQGEFETAADACNDEIHLSDEDAERYLPRDEAQENLIISKECRIPPLTSVIRYGEGYYVLKKGRVMREGFSRTLPEYKQ